MPDYLFLGRELSLEQMGEICVLTGCGICESGVTEDGHREYTVNSPYARPPRSIKETLKGYGLAARREV
jgi:hypothetical protein